MEKIKHWLLIAAFLAVCLFILQNWEPVGVRFLIWRFELPRLVMVLLLVGVGFVAGLLVTRRDPPKGSVSELE